MCVCARVCVCVCVCVCEWYTVSAVCVLWLYQIYSTPVLSCSGSIGTIFRIHIHIMGVCVHVDVFVLCVLISQMNVIAG